MPTYYIRADGTAANKEAATSDANASTSMNVTVHNSETFAAGDVRIISDAGGVYRGTRLTVPSGGSVGSPAIYLGSGLPLLKGSIDISTDSYLWTPSAAGTNCYYCRLGGGPGKNLWENADLEAGVGDWNVNGNCAISSSTEQAWEQTHSLKIAPNDAWWSARSDVKPVEASTQYTVSLYVYYAGAIANDYIYIYDQDNNEISSAALTVTPGSWVRISRTFTTGVGDTGIKVHLEGQDQVNVYADGVQLEPGGSATGWENYGAGGGSNPSLIDPGQDLVFLDDVSCELGASVAALTDHQWFFGDADTLGYDTIYIRDDSGDPDTTGVLIEASQIACFYSYQHDYVTVDGIEVRHGHGAEYIGGIRSIGGDYVIVQNCEAHWCNGEGIAISAGDYCTIDNCVASYNGMESIYCGGTSEGVHSVGMTIKNCISHHARVMGYLDENPFDGYGIKFQWVDDSSIYGNSSYSNEFEGIDLDTGCLRNRIYENVIYDNAWEGILIELHCADNQIFRNLIYDNSTAGEYGGEINVWHRCTGTRIYNNLVYKTAGTAAADNLVQIGEWEAGYGCTGTLIYGNVLDGGGVSNNCINVDGYLCPQNLKIKNNIFINSVNAPIWVNGADETGLESDYNCFDVSGGNIIVRGDYASYTKATHFATFAQDGNSLDTDPLLTDAEGHNYSLGAESPCIGAGVDLGDDYDDALHPDSTWPDSVIIADQDAYGYGWEIGAYVFTDVGDDEPPPIISFNLTGVLSMKKLYKK